MGRNNTSKAVLTQNVQALRDTIADELIRSGWSYSQNEPAKSLLNKSFLLKHIDIAPLDEPESALAFNLQIADLGITKILNSEEDPNVILQLSSRMLEISHYDFIDPLTLKHITYLGASKEQGYFFTPLEIANEMAEILLKNVSVSASPKLLDPTAGIGMLAGAAMIVGAAKGLKFKKITAIEADGFTASQMQQVLERLKHLLGESIEVETIHGDSLEALKNLQSEYDFVIMNPPYGRIKFLESSLTNAETKTAKVKITHAEQIAKNKLAVKSKQLQIKNIAAHLGVTKGLGEYYRVFSLMSLNALNNTGKMTVITPNTWLGDMDSTEYRKLLVNKRMIYEIVLLKESSAYFPTVNQALTIAAVSKEASDSILIKQGLRSKSSLKIEMSDIEKNDPVHFRIPGINPKLYPIYEKLRSLPKLGEYAGFKCARGEVDLTLNKDKITSQETGVVLYKGNDIERYCTRPRENADLYVTDYVLNQVNGYRLAGRQISYLEKNRRLSFSMIEPMSALGNSCNYISVVNTEYEATEAPTSLWMLLGVLNSAVAEWYFRIFNSNNHVAIFEIKDLPFPEFTDVAMEEIAKSAQFLYAHYRGETKQAKVPSKLEDLHEALIAFNFGLLPDDIKSICVTLCPSRAARISNMLKWMLEGEQPQHILKSTGWMDHFTPTLSELDKTIIHYVPQGGNWANIPDDVPSQRIKQIKEMSKERGIVRTTYYGRLRPDQPSYTIATYFNRPGNGTNIHPWEDRTLSLREAARLQSFPDSYVFLGTEGSVRKQIGNAVPCLLGYAVGKAVANFHEPTTCVDAFSGAGGLSIGLEMAGWKSIAAIDNDKGSSMTYRFNRPSTLDPDETDKCFFNHGDISKKEDFDVTIKAIKKRLGGKKLGLLAGGPPCQGFSYAGFRRADDIRNNLATLYLTMAKELQPETFILENVEGLLTFNGGQVIRDILKSLSDMGYKTEHAPWVLNAEEYGAPQMRRRVFIVVSKTHAIKPPTKTHLKCLGRREPIDTPITLLPDSLPYPNTSGEALHDLTPLGPVRYVENGRRPIRDSFSEWVKGFSDSPI